MNRETILKTASLYTTIDRNATHGDAENSFADVATLWAWWLKDKHANNLGAFDVAMMMALFKIVRIKGNQAHVDSFVDACGYLAIAGEISCGQK